MALREEDVRDSEKEQEFAEESIFDDWFWRPFKRYEARFVDNAGERSGWRESGRRLQIATRVSSHLDSKQARLAYLYDREGDRGRDSHDVTNQKKGRRKW